MLQRMDKYGIIYTLSTERYLMRQDYDGPLNRFKSTYLRRVLDMTACGKTTEIPSLVEGTHTTMCPDEDPILVFIGMRATDLTKVWNWEEAGVI